MATRGGQDNLVHVDAVSLDVTVYDVPAGDMLVDDAIPLPGCGTPVGTSIDRDGYVWVVDQGTNTHDVVLSVEGLVQLYTNSDMTGSGLDLVVDPPG